MDFVVGSFSSSDSEGAKKIMEKLEEMGYKITEIDGANWFISKTKPTIAKVGSNLDSAPKTEE